MARFADGIVRVSCANFVIMHSSHVVSKLIILYIPFSINNVKCCDN